MLLGFNGYPLAAMALTLGAEVYLLVLGKGVRWIAFLSAFTAVFAVAAFPPWLDALAKVFGTGSGMVVLVVITFISGAAYITDHWRHLHVTRTPILGTIAGTTGVLTFAMRSQLAQQGAKIGPGTGAALSQGTQQIASGQAASSMSAPSAAVILGVALVLIFVVWRFRRRLHLSRTEQGRPFFHVQPFGVPLERGGHKALPAGGGGAPGGPGGNTGKPAKGDTGFFSRWGRKK